ncbi:MAG: class I SAM-dependent methyltransferase [Candidatus Eisenbacteria bacterium]|nr:class I SAM-dependent methyltransferase [Candidatus Eisenbacteria bacterium]
MTDEAGLGDPSWEEPAQVEEFAARATDHRLLELVTRFPDPSTVQVLDLGCAGGRNTEFLVRAGFDVLAVDASLAMVRHTRVRIAPILGQAEAERRVRVARMDTLPFVESSSRQLVVALGIYFLARSAEEWSAALAESTRVLAPGGYCLVANFGPGFGPIDALPERVGTSFVYRHESLGTICLLEPEELDLAFQQCGLSPVVPTVAVEREAEGIRRVTVNALYRRLPA